MRIYAIFNTIGGEDTAPIYMSLNFSELEKKLKKEKRKIPAFYENAYIAFVELYDSEITYNINLGSTEYDEISKDFLWKVYEGRISQYVYKNLETGEITEYEPYCDYDEVYRTRVYKEGKLVEEFIFE